MIVNRLWQKHFGRGIVATLENFGKMGEAPTHQELLDWLAVELMKDWSLKRINKLMMMSEAYQMASAFDDADRREERSGEPLSVALPPQRLEAEIVRDSMLAAGGNINLRDRRRADLSATSRRTCSPDSIAASGSTRRRARQRGGGASTCISGARCPIRCSTPSIIRT